MYLENKRMQIFYFHWDC